MRVRGSSPVVAAATILARGGMPMDLSAKDLPERAEDRGQLLAEVDRKEAGGFRNGLEMLDAFRDLFDSYDEMDEFADALARMREEDRARYRS
jgi:hypothetical protein